MSDQESSVPPEKSGVVQKDRANERPRNFDKTNTVSMKVTVGVRTGWKDFEVTNHRLRAGKWEYQLKEKETGQLYHPGEWFAEPNLKDPS